MLRLHALSDAPQAFGSSYASTITQPEQYWIDRLRDVECGRSILLFAERDQQLIGMIGAFWGSGDTAPGYATIIAVYVRPEFRGYGVASQLLTTVLATLAKVPDIRRVELTVNPMQISALHLYRRRGFEVVRSMRSEMGDGIEYDEFVMEREIDRG